MAEMINEIEAIVCSNSYFYKVGELTSYYGETAKVIDFIGENVPSPNNSVHYYTVVFKDKSAYKIYNVATAIYSKPKPAPTIEQVKTPLIIN